MATAKVEIEEVQKTCTEKVPVVILKLSKEEAFALNDFIRYSNLPKVLAIHKTISNILF